MEFIIKTILSALIIALVSMISKKYSSVGALIASLPLTSILAMIWFYRDTKSPEKVSKLSMSIFWLVIPSLLFFVLLSQMLNRNMNFYLALILSSTLTVVFYFIYIMVLKYFKIEL